MTESESAGPDPFDAFVRDPRTAGIFTDFDGTLAPIVDDPATSRPLAGAPEVLAALAARVGRVAVISGRPVEVLGRFFEPSIELSGLYGLQRLVDGRRVDHAEASAWAPVIDDTVSRARRDVPEGIRVEPKGLSVTLHYRERPELGEAAERWAEGEAARSGLRCHRARMSVELHPPIDADKGTAVRSLADGLTSVAFVGDDVGDLPAFATLDTLAASGVHTVKVAVHSVGAGPAVWPPLPTSSSTDPTPSWRSSRRCSAASAEAAPPQPAAASCSASQVAGVRARATARVAAACSARSAGRVPSARASASAVPLTS